VRGGDGAEGITEPTRWENGWGMRKRAEDDAVG
jgi:hypothetical protein